MYPLFLSPARPLGRSGQFMPISAMVTFTTVVFLVAAVNVYQVSRAKLKVQNLADAAALNIASQMASSMNKTADLNEWMNHLIAQAANAPPSKPGEVPDCSSINPDYPPLSCAENPTKSSNLNMFTVKGNAAAYATLVQKINQSQQMFIDAYNNFIGAGSGSNSSIGSKSSLSSILLADIPELGNPGTFVKVWNEGPPSQAQSQSPSASNTTSSSLDTTGMRPLKFQIHDVAVTFKTTIPILNTPGPPVTMTLGQLLANNGQSVTPVGWMVPDPDQPLINVGSGSSSKSRVGAGVQVTRNVKVPILGVISVSAQSQAYVVDGSGSMGTAADMVTDSSGMPRPTFKPTYWVKLAEVK